MISIGFLGDKDYFRAKSLFRLIKIYLSLSFPGRESFRKKNTELYIGI